MSFTICTFDAVHDIYRIDLDKSGNQYLIIVINKELDSESSDWLKKFRYTNINDAVRDYTMLVENSALSYYTWEQRFEKLTGVRE